MNSAGIILNGTSLDIAPNDEIIICADGGYKLIKDTIKPDYLIGDMDSISEEIPNGIHIIKHNPQKDNTDGELCILFAVEKGYKNINIYAAMGGRIDHILGNLSLLALADSLGAVAVAREKGLNIYYTKKNFTLATKKGDTISVIPFAGNAVIESSKGLYYPLDNLTIFPHFSGVGISNLALAESISISVAEGGVFIFHYF